MPFKIGDKVMCISNEHRYENPPCPLKCNHVYEIVAVAPHKTLVNTGERMWYTNGVHLDVGVSCPASGNQWWGAMRFRKVENPKVVSEAVKASMAEFKQFLVKTTGVNP